MGPIEDEKVEMEGERNRLGIRGTGRRMTGLGGSVIVSQADGDESIKTRETMKICKSFSPFYEYYRWKIENLRAISIALMSFAIMESGIKRD